MALLPAPPSRRLGGELTSVDTINGAAVLRPCRPPATPPSGTSSEGVHRFQYHRKREAVGPAQIQPAESPQNPGRFTVMWSTRFETDVVSGPGCQASTSWSRPSISVRRYASLRWNMSTTAGPISPASSFDMRSILAASMPRTSLASAPGARRIAEIERRGGWVS